MRGHKRSHIFQIGEQVPGTLFIALEAIKWSKEQGGNLAYRLKCACGRIIEESVSNLVRGKSRSCIRCRPSQMPSETESVSMFWEKVDKSGECWEWTGCKNEDGYGLVTYRGELTSTHRISWRIHFGCIPEDKKVLHTCDNPACVNPKHLWLGTQLDNVRDCISKGRFRPRGKIPSQFQTT